MSTVSHSDLSASLFHILLLVGSFFPPTFQLLGYPATQLNTHFIHKWPSIEIKKHWCSFSSALHLLSVLLLSAHAHKQTNEACKCMKTLWCPHQFTLNHVITANYIFHTTGNIFQLFPLNMKQSQKKIRWKTEPAAPFKAIMSDVVHLSAGHHHIQLLLQKKLIFTPAFTNTCMYWEKEEESLQHLDPNSSSQENRPRRSTSGTFSPKQMLWTVKVQMLSVKDHFSPLCERSATTFSNILPSETSSSPVVLLSSNRKWTWRNIKVNPGCSPNFCSLEQNQWRSVGRLEIHLGWLQLRDSSLIS